MSSIICGLPNAPYLVCREVLVEVGSFSLQQFTLILILPQRYFMFIVATILNRCVLYQGYRCPSLIAIHSHRSVCLTHVDRSVVITRPTLQSCGHFLSALQRSNYSFEPLAFLHDHAAAWGIHASDSAAHGQTEFKAAV